MDGRSDGEIDGWGYHAPRDPYAPRHNNARPLASIHRPIYWAYLLYWPPHSPDPTYLSSPAPGSWLGLGLGLGLGSGLGLELELELGLGLGPGLGLG